ncbi:hypothetical protein HT118_10150 [Escherichia coli]|nr:hypothetical protein [Escherichia coli]
MLKGGISGRSAKGKRIHTRAIHSIDTDIKTQPRIVGDGRNAAGEHALMPFP